jgi:imidazolonepropionase-like amidohydrolase
MIAIINGEIYTMAGNIIKKGIILIDKGIIKDLGSDIEIADDAEIIDASGKIIIPGMIDAHTHLGIDEEGIGWEGKDYNEMTNPITPHLRAIDAVNPRDDGLKSARENGITSVMTSPGSANVLGGEAAAIKTVGNFVDDMIIKAPVGIKAAFGENPKKVYTERKESPGTRMGIAALIRETLMEAQDYKLRKERALEQGEIFKRKLKYESLLKLLNKEIPLKAHAHRADDIMTALRIASEFDLKLTIEHCTEGHLAADKIAEAKVPAVVGPLLTAKVKVELKEQDFKTAAVLAEAGVKIALVSDHPVTPTERLPLYAALAVKSGLKKVEALKAITINPAEILGIDDRVGSLEKGKDADLVIFNGEPLDFNSSIDRVMISGRFIN